MQSEKSPALVQVWAKGFRVSERSQEFQLVVPSETEVLQPGEGRFVGASWGEHLQILYRLKPVELSREFAVVLDPRENTASLVAASHSEDKSSRTSMVVVAATTRIDWQANDLSRRVEAARSLSLRLSEAYAKVLRGAQPSVERQLREGRFLPEREFDLSVEVRDTATRWSDVVAEIKRWKGVRGVATKNLAFLGANVLFGTRDEAERNRGRSPGLDGYLDVASRKLVPLNSNLELWPQPEERASFRAEGASEQPDPLLEINEKINRLAQQQSRTHRLLEAVHETLRIYGMARRSSKKRKG